MVALGFSPVIPSLWACIWVLLENYRLAIYYWECHFERFVSFI